MKSMVNTPVKPPLKPLVPPREEIRRELARALLTDSVAAGTIDAIESGLIGPLHEYLSRPGKGLRGELVELGYLLAAQAAHLTPASQSAPQAQLDQVASLIEALHAGSMIVDDIEDDARIRRGKAAMHRAHGVPIALNGANWLYFLATSMIKGIGLPAEQELWAHRLVSQVLFDAHLGQALDISTRIDTIEQANVKSLVLNAIELKTGVLAGLAASLGAAIGAADPKVLQQVEWLGRKLGVALQMFDDLGNLYAADPAKRFEDLYLRRPTWVWAFAAESSSAEEYAQLTNAVRQLPDSQPLQDWLAEHHFRERAKQEASVFLEQCRTRFNDWNVPAAATLLLHRIFQKLREQYV